MCALMCNLEVGLERVLPIAMQSTVFCVVCSFFYVCFGEPSCLHLCEYRSDVLFVCGEYVIFGVSCCSVYQSAKNVNSG